MLKKTVQVSVLTIVLSVCLMVQADGTSIDKIYKPYVQPLEQELEYRVLIQQGSTKALGNQRRHKVGYGQSLTDRFFAELYIIGANNQEQGFTVEAYELELKWQLTEQGEFENDFGLLFELEKSRSNNSGEASSTLIALHECPNWILTGNISLIYEWSNDKKNELETAIATQLRYRYKAFVEPAIELYQSQDTQGIGPVLTGLYRLGNRKKLLWEFGVILGTNKKTASSNWKLNVEYEF